MSSKELKRKNWALFAVLMGVVLILFVVTLIRFGSAGQ